MIFWMAGGMVMLNEISYYTALELFGIFISICISCTGIKVLTMKIKKQRRELISMNESFPSSVKDYLMTNDKI